MQQLQATFRRFTVELRVLSIVLLLAAAGAMNAQVAGTGSIQGLVSDSTGAVLPNAAVTLIATGTGVTLNTKTDSSGIYVFPDIAIGTYSIKVVSSGFQTYTESNVVLEVGSSISINIKMTVGSESQHVEVHSEGLALQTEDPSYKQTIDSTEITEMPLNGRQISGLLQLSGAINNGGGNDSTGSKFSYQSIGVSVAGSMGNSTQWRLDGGDNADYMAGANLPLPFPDAVSQFSVEASALGAQDGMHAGGMVNVITRSGTNSFHGSGFEFIRNNLIDATNFYTNPCTATSLIGSCGKNTLHQDQYGFTIGGPVWLPKIYNGRDKLFFFAGYQYSRSKSTNAASSAYVPTAANLAGNFQVEDGVPSSVPGSATQTFSAQPNSICSTKATQLLDPLTGNALPGNAYATPPTYNAQSLALQKYLPAISPLPDGSDVCGHVFYTTPNANFDKQFITRMDYTINSTNHLYGRYMLDSYQLPSYFSTTNILLTAANGNPEQRVQTGTIGEDHTFSSNLVNSAHITVLRRLNHRGYNASAITACTLGVQNFNCGPTIGLDLSAGGNLPSGFTMGGGTNSLAVINDNTLAINDDLTWLHGRHQFVMGGEFVRNQLNINNAYESIGIFTGFGASYSSYGPYGSNNQSALNQNYCASCTTQPSQNGNGMLDFLQGTIGGNSFQQSRFQQNALRTNYPSLYIQDTFHATKQLTLVAGLRWDPYYFPIDVLNRGTNFSYANFVANVHSSVYPNAPAGMLYYGDPGVSRSFTQSSPNEFDPNIGFTYDPVGDGKTVLRGGAEYMYDAPNNFTAQRNQQNPPFGFAVSQSLNSYDSFSNPWAVPNLSGGYNFGTNPGPGAANASTLTTNPFPVGSLEYGVPGSSAAFFNGSQYIVPVAKFHPAVYAQWTASVQRDFGHGWLATLQYIGSKGDHEQFGTQLSPSIYIPGVSTSSSPSSSSCNVTINGTNYWLGENGSVAPPAVGKPCSTTGNETQRDMLTLINPSQGNLIGGTNNSVVVNDIAISTYEGMVVSVNHRLSSTFSVLANYTWSKCLDEYDNNGDVSGVSAENPNNIRGDYGPCGFDYRNVLNVVPVLKSNFTIDNNLVRAIVNNWEFGGLAHISTGSVFSITTGNDDDEIGGGTGDRATRIANVPLYAKVRFRSASGAANRQYLNPAAFQTNNSYYTSWEATSATNLGTGAPVYGNTGRNAFHAPPVINFDGQVTRDWKLHEGLNMTTRLESFNLLNHPNFGTPTSNVTSGSFGQISGTAGSSARVFQGALKFVF
jgi:Carboxypeptidase regulatory-like domain